MREIFGTRKTKRAVRERYKINLEIPMVNQASLGTKSLRLYGDPRFGTLSQITLYWSKIYVLRKFTEQALICYVLNIVSNCKNIFCLVFFVFYYLLYVPVDRRRNFDILSKRQNNKVSFTCHLGWSDLISCICIYIFMYR